MTDIANGLEIQNVFRGDAIKSRLHVRVATIADVDLSSDLSVATIDGVSLSVGDRILVKNQDDSQDINTIDTTGATGSGINGTYFILYDENGSVAFWIDTDDSGTLIPDNATLADRAIEITTIAAADTAGTIATKIRAVINTDSKFSAPAPAGNVITVTLVQARCVNAADEGTSGFTITNTQNGCSSIDHGMYVVGSGAGNTFRAEDLVNGDDAELIYLSVGEGTVNKLTTWMCTSNPAIVGTNNLQFVQTNAFNYTVGDIFYANSDHTIAALKKPSETSLLEIDALGNLAWTSKEQVDETINTVTTSDATVTTIATISTSTNISYIVEATIVARRTDSGSESGGYHIKAVFRNNGGTLTKVASDDKVSIEDTNPWDVSTSVSGTNILIRVTGQSSKTIDWKSSYKILSV